jgi:hypothetical protein
MCEEQAGFRACFKISFNIRSPPHALLFFNDLTAYNTSASVISWFNSILYSVILVGNTLNRQFREYQKSVIDKLKKLA